MAYEANREGDQRENQMSQDERNIQNNANNIRNAAEVAMASGNPYAMAAGAAVKAADKLTGGKSTEMAGKALNQANKMAPGGNQVQNSLNKMSESGASDKIGQAAAIKNGMSNGGSGGADAASKAGDAANAADKASSTSSSSSDSSGGFGKGFGGKKPKNWMDDGDDMGGEEQDPLDSMFEFQMKPETKAIMLLVAPLAGILLLFFAISGAVGGGVADFDDALGASGAAGGETGNIVFTASDPEAQAFYDRINSVKLKMQANGKSVDALKIASVYHVMNVNNNDYDYKFMTESVITEIANGMFSGNVYDETTFKYNLTNVIFYKYFPRTSQKKREQMTEEVFDYMDRYFSFIGSEGYGCAAAGACNYDIKGFYIPGAGNIPKQMQISNLMVRLMECGKPYGNGTYGKAIDQDLVPFEEYVAGVAYAEVGPSAHIEVLKAQMVMARSFALARPTGMGNALGKKLEEENGRWVLQISSCVADQVFCNINEGCSFMGGGDGQGGICRSGKVPGAVRTRDALAAEHQLRTAMAATAGEVLVNDQGYIIQAGYLATEQKLLSSLASQGMNYKQMLLQVYNSGNRNYGAADIQKMSCNTAGSANCGTASSGPYASWKQYEGPWTTVPMGNSGKNIRQIGCLVTSISMLVAKSGVPTVINDFNPGTFVQFLNNNGGFVSGGNYVWASVSKAAPSFQFVGRAYVSGYTKNQKLKTLTDLMNQGYYVVAEVKGNTGQHWVAVDAIAGQTIIMMDPGSSSTDMWAQYDWRNTSTFAYFKAG